MCSCANGAGVAHFCAILEDLVGMRCIADLELREAVLCTSTVACVRSAVVRSPGNIEPGGLTLVSIGDCEHWFLIMIL